ELVVSEPDLSIEEGAIGPWAGHRLGYWQRLLDAVAKAYRATGATPWRRLPKEAREAILFGTDKDVQVTYRNRFGRLRSYTTSFEGVIPNLERRYKETDSEGQR